ncbi:hypothetical protein DNL40_00665 [Xylanimonas oleitrophica]|uniref:Integral membrane protein n=1 Tax=Xylanimonas oleitrophica TaxID=2607479 RepID=A0A2W5X3H1_9MICO|nr:hypothetical protein [Xylanimonas oleitrophica]PZR54945.1 hypothetical protein DNL40_00665 [Xylanimonas oleitrophica]
MNVLFDVFLFLHFVGWAIVLGGYLASMRTPGLYRGVFHGAATALVAGVVMFGIIESQGWGFDRAALTVKLLLALVITVLAFLAKRQGAKGDNGTGAVAPGLKHAIGGLTLVNMVVAVFWLG